MQEVRDNKVFGCWQGEIEKLKHIHSQHTLSIERDEAREQGTEIISYDELLGMLEG